MFVNSVSSWKEDISIQSIPLVYPDNKEEFGLRYIWMKHRYDNNYFLKNYFNEGNQKGINVRDLTKDFKIQWNIHNEIFNQSAQNGNLVWRVKALNIKNRSIDYIEVWKNTKIIYELLEKNINWPEDSMNTLKKGLYDAGFSAQKWIPFPTVSREWVLSTYEIFKNKSKLKDNCIINTELKFI